MTNLSMGAVRARARVRDTQSGFRAYDRDASESFANDESVGDVGLGFGYGAFSNYITTGTFPMGMAITAAFFTLAGIFACFTAIILHSLNTHL